MESDAGQKANSVPQGEKEHEKLLATTEASRSVHYGDVAGSSASAERSSLASSKALSEGTSKEKYLKKLAEEDTPKASCKKKALKVVVTVLFIIIVVGIIVIWTFHEGRSRKHTGNQYFDFIAKKRVLNVYNDDMVLSGTIKTGAFDIGQAKKCHEDQMDSIFCYTFDDGTIFRFELYSLNNAQVHCNNLIWENVKSSLAVSTDCFDVRYGMWYGLPNFQGKFWPINVEEMSLSKVTYQPYADEILGQVLENYWLNSDGTALIAHQRHPIKISLNSGYKNQLCLSLDFTNTKLHLDSFVFNYSICQGPDIKTTFLATRNRFFPHSKVVNLTQHDLSNIVWKYENRTGNFGQFLDKLNKSGFPMKLVEYDARWEEYPGELKLMQTNEIELNLREKYLYTKLMIPISLACSYLSENFETGIRDSLFVRDIHTDGIKTVTYEDQSCALWDASNPATVAFLKDRLRELQKVGTSEEIPYPQAYMFKTVVTNKAIHHLLYKNTTDLFTMNVMFDALLLELNKSVLSETAYHMQNLTSFVEIPTVVASNGGKKCLDYLIPGALTAGIHGYPYFTAIAPSEDSVNQELFVRWLQVAIFFPGLEVTNSVFSLGEMLTNVTKTLSDFRQSVIIPALSKAVNEVADGVPLLRPMWWRNPLDYRALKSSDQFFVGDSIFVAPVLCHGDRKRDIYVPTGKWRHYKTKVVYTGNKWLKDYPVEIDDVPVFLVVQDSSQTRNTQSM